MTQSDRFSRNTDEKKISLPPIVPAKGEMGWGYHALEQVDVVIWDGFHLRHPMGVAKHKAAQTA